MSRHLVHLFSKRRTEGTSTDYRIRLYEPLKNVVSARLVQAVVPNSARNVRPGSNLVKYSVMETADLQFKLEYNPLLGQLQLSYLDGRGTAPVFVAGATHIIRVLGAGISVKLRKATGETIIRGTGFDDPGYFATGDFAYTPPHPGEAFEVDAFTGGDHAYLASSVAYQPVNHLYSVALPVGAYSSISLISKLSSLLKEDARIAGVEPWSVRYLSAEDRFSIQPTVARAFFSLYFDQETPHHLMGWASPGVYVGTPEVESTDVPRMGGTLCIKLHVEELGNTYHTFSVSEPHPFTFCFPASANLGDVIIATPEQLSHTRVDMNPMVRDIARLSVKIMDDDGEVMDIQGQDSYMCLEVVCN
jgi:hypothetical protein